MAENPNSSHHPADIHRTAALTARAITRMESRVGVLFDYDQA
jgi:hypothetical protein